MQGATHILRNRRAGLASVKFSHNFRATPRFRCTGRLSMPYRTLLALFGIFGLMLLLTGCRGSGKPKVAFVSNNAYEFWTFAQKGAEKAAAEEDVELDFKKPQEDKVEVQQEIIDSLISRGFKGVAVSPNDPDNTVSYYKN